jgi:hypothetical protein
VSDGLPHLDRALSAAELGVIVGSEPQSRRAQLLGGVTDEHGSRGGQLLQTGRGVHDVAHRRVVGAGHRADQDLAGVDADAQADSVVRVLLAEVAECRLHRERRSDRPVGVVLVSDRCPEQRDDRVPEHLVDDTAVVLDVGDEPSERGVDEPLDLLGVTMLGERGEADQVGEQHGDHASLFVGERVDEQDR